MYGLPFLPDAVNLLPSPSRARPLRFHGDGEGPRTEKIERYTMLHHLAWPQLKVESEEVSPEDDYQTNVERLEDVGDTDATKDPLGVIDEVLE